MQYDFNFWTDKKIIKNIDLRLDYYAEENRLINTGKL